MSASCFGGIRHPESKRTSLISWQKRVVARVVLVERPHSGSCILHLATFAAAVTMRDFASCLSHGAVQVAHSASSSGGQNLVQCAYLARLRGKPCRVTVTWSKVAMGQALAVAIHDCSNRCLCKTEVKPWLFSKMKGSKVMELDGGDVEVIWDLSSAKFAAGPEPVEGFHVSLVCDLEVVLVLGDLHKEESHSVLSDASHCDAVVIARKEHIYAKKVYSAKAQFVDIGQLHHISIECDTAGVRDPSLEIRIDKKKVLQVKRLAWKFRGNQTIYVDGLPVEVLWDVHDWLFTSSSGCAVFLFQSGQSMEKFLRTCSRNEKEAQAHRFGFTLILNAWKTE